MAHLVKLPNLSAVMADALGTTLEDLAAEAF